MTPEEIKQLNPEKQLRFWLIQHGYPFEDIPKILRYCPQLAQRFSIETIAMAALTEFKLFKPIRTAIMIRPFVMLSARQDLEVGENITSFVEESMSTFANETIELTLQDLIVNLLADKGLGL